MITGSKPLIYEFSISEFTKLVNIILMAKKKAKTVMRFLYIIIAHELIRGLWLIRQIYFPDLCGHCSKQSCSEY